MSDLVGNPEDRFSHNEAHLYPCEKVEELYKNCSRAVLEQFLEQFMDFKWPVLEPLSS